MKKVYILNDDKLDEDIDLDEYTHIRVYHACRTSNVEKYLNEGIHYFTKDESYEIVKTTLLQCGMKENEIKEVFDRHWKNSIHHFNTICVGISKHELLTESGHYLLYGSEFICGMASQLLCQNKLKKIGVPTLFVCDIHKSKFPKEVLTWIENKDFYNGEWDGGIYLKDEIDCSEIVDYIQPKEVFDHLM